MKPRTPPDGLAAALAPFGSLYAALMRLRAAAYRRGVLGSIRIDGATVISVGNLTTGGTGKTPLVRLVAQLAAEELARRRPPDAARPPRVCVLSRGYGRRTRGRVLVSDGADVFADARAGGDEPLELAEALRGTACVIADADRAAAARWAVERFGTKVFVLDDGFQHLRLSRDLDIVAIDATDPFGGGRVLPAGRLREPVAALSRADLVILTRAEQVASTAELAATLARFNDRAPVLRALTGARGLRPLAPSASGTNLPVAAETGDLPAFAFCGLGNPSAFFRTLADSGLRSAGTLAFPDHHRYTPADIARITSAARDGGAAVLITTMKDAVKLRGADWELPCYALETAVEIDDEAMLRRFVSRSLARTHERTPRAV